jgi:DNA-binding NarL/FixJ family response regulator
MPQNNMIERTNKTALIADDHEVFRAALSTLLRTECGFARTVEAGSLDEAVERLGENSNITFATFDLGMPGVDGATSLHSIRQVFPSLGTAVVAGSERREDIFAAMMAGMHGYIPKTLPTLEIVRALQTVLSGMIYLPWSVAQPPPIGEPFTLDTSGDMASAAYSKLTPRQRDVLRCIREGKSNKEIARMLGLTESTVKVHTNALYRTLGVRNRVGAAATQMK